MGQRFLALTSPQTRWERYCRDLAALERELGIEPSRPLPDAAGVPVTDRQIEIATPFVRARLDRRRGLAIQRAGFAPDFTPLIGGIPHGHFDDIALQADWYTGDCVFEAPGEPKVTDLDWAETHIVRAPDGSITVHGEIATALGPVIKVMTFRAGAPRIDFDLEFRWENWARGVLRLGHITRWAPPSTKGASLSPPTNGGAQPERFALEGQMVEHGAPVSFLVSASCALGMTEGWLELADKDRACGTGRGGPRGGAAGRSWSITAAPAASCSASSSCQRWSWTIPASRRPIARARGVFAFRVVGRSGRRALQRRHDARRRRFPSWPGTSAGSGSGG